MSDQRWGLDDWVHDDGTPCGVLLAPDCPDDGYQWWCTVHEQYVRRPAVKDAP